jgi:hypothetical protein
MWHFAEAGVIDKTSEIKLADGRSMKFEFRGKRQ